MLKEVMAKGPVIQGDEGTRIGCKHEECCGPGLGQEEGVIIEWL